MALTFLPLVKHPSGRPALTVEDRLLRMVVGGRIRAGRIAKEMSQIELSALAFTCAGAISNYEHGKRLPNKTTLQRICDVLNLDIEAVTETYP